MGKRAFPVTLVAGMAVALFCGIALYLRIVPSYDKVFVGDWIKFTTPDAYYYMRQVDSLVHNFPHLISFDPYRNYPYGQSLVGFNLFVYFLGGIVWLIGLGAPTQHTIDIVGVYFPAVLGALDVILVYFIGKELFNRWAGVIAAGLLAILPGEFLGRSIIGATDRDAFEVLLTALTMLFLILAIKNARQKEIGFNLRPLGRAITKPLVYSLLTGVFLGFYLLTWVGAFLFVFIIFAYFIIQSIIDHLKHKNINYLSFVGIVTFLIALLIFLPSHPGLNYLVLLVIALLTPPVLALISGLMLRARVKVGYYPLAIFGLGLISLAVLYVVNPSIPKSLLSQLQIFFPSETERIVIEMQPLLFPSGRFSFVVAWANFTTGLFLSLISLGILIHLVIKRGEADKTLILVWSLVIMGATLALRRMALLYAVNVALLSGYVSWLVLQLVGFKEAPAESVESSKRNERQKGRRRLGSHLAASRANMALGVLIVFFVTFLPNINRAINVSSQAYFAPSDACCESLSWMKDNTPDPSGNHDFYYDLYKAPFGYPGTAYGVAAWWEYGYLVIRIGHRLTNCDPGGGDRVSVADFFTSQNEAQANTIMNKLGSRYVIIDHDLTEAVTGKFEVVAMLNGNSFDFCDIYYQLEGGRLNPVVAFYPEYYQSTVVRLYNFNGEQVIPHRCTVISYEDKISSGGQPYKQITGIESFPTYEAAQAYVTRQKSGNYRIAGGNPFISPVPLEKLEHYKLVYSSKYTTTQPDIGMVPEVKIFEYIK